MNKEYNYNEGCGYRHDIYELIRSIPMDRLDGPITVKGAITPPPRRTMEKLDDASKISFATQDLNELETLLLSLEPNSYICERAGIMKGYIKTYGDYTELTTRERRIWAIGRMMSGHASRTKNLIKVVRYCYELNPQTGKQEGVLGRRDVVSIKYFLS